MKQTWSSTFRSIISCPSIDCSSTKLATLTTGAVAKLAQFSSPQSQTDSIFKARSCPSSGSAPLCFARYTISSSRSGNTSLTRGAAIALKGSRIAPAVKARRAMRRAGKILGQGCSNPAGVGRPDVLVNLDLQAHRNPISQDPFGECRGLQGSEHRAHQDGVHAPVEVARANRGARPLIVGAIGQHELDFVTRAQVLEVAPQVAIAFPAARAFEVHDLDDARVEAAHIDGARGFDHDCVLRLEEVVD